MIQLTPQMRILPAVQPVDFRKGIDGLSAICRSLMGADPFSGCIFAFRNRRKTTIKLLTYDCIIRSKTAAIPLESCHPFRAKVATLPVERCHFFGIARNL